MPVFTINVKWQKDKFTDIECDTDQPPEVFKATMFSLSGVPPDRQKIMMAGGVLKNDSWEKIKLKNGVTVMMMGNTEELPKELPPAELPKFVEDMDETQLAEAMQLPPGLNNLGNTCYMNATIQCLFSIPELKDSLPKLPRTSESGNMEAHSMVMNMRDLFEQMKRSSNPISPTFFLGWLHNIFPQFSTRGENGVWQQQDANECWTELIRCLQKSLTLADSSPLALTGSENGAGAAKGGRINFIERYMSGELQVKLSTEEAPDEEATISTDSFNQLSCYIDKDVKYLSTGLKSGLEGTVEKLSPTLGKDAVYKKISQISRLPGYLSVQFVRFYYKEKENVNAKVLKDVKFPMVLDMYDFCSEDLQKKLLPMREKFKEHEDRTVEQVSKAKQGDGAAGKANKIKKEEKEPEYEDYAFKEDVGSNNSGYYELQAVLTHQGRSSNSGHYVGWVRRKGDEWYKFDDEKVSSITSEDILRLSGGGDWHCAYVLLYGPRRLEVAPTPPLDTAVVDASQVDSEKMETS